MPERHFDQESIYDLRYGAGYNGTGSPVNVLSAERAAMTSAVRRFHGNNDENVPKKVVDFGSGVCRVPNDLISMWMGPGDFNLVAYDVSRVGLTRAMDSMRHHLPIVTVYEKTDRVVGECSSPRSEKHRRSVRFVHGNPKLPPEDIAEILLEENDESLFDITTSWYDAVSHAPSEIFRKDIFSMLGAITQPKGEVVVTASTIGDVDSAYDPEFVFEELPRDSNGDRNVIYTTEIGVENYLHLYGKDFEDYVRRLLTDGSQNVWVQPIRLRGEEYVTSTQEQEAYGELLKLAEERSGREWTLEDYATIHTVGGFRSPTLPEGQLACSST